MLFSRIQGGVLPAQLRLINHGERFSIERVVEKRNCGEWSWMLLRMAIDDCFRGWEGSEDGLKADVFGSASCGLGGFRSDSCKGV